jgi:hypothetical protein
MKYNSLVFMLILVLFSCKKESINKIEEIPVKEKFISEFTNYQTQLDFHFKSWNGGCGSIDSYQTYKLRLKAGFETGEKYFYAIETSSLFTGPCFLLNTPWTQIDGYYRYSFDEKKALYYQDINDQNPKVLMDFNCQVGDTIVMDQSSFTSIIVTSISSETIQNIVFPKIIGRVVSISKTGQPNPEFKPSDANPNKLLALTPFSCNPFWHGFNLNGILHDGWYPPGFCISFTTPNTLIEAAMSCNNTLTNSVYYWHGLYIGPN